MQTNPAFTEAYLVGLNHALARELAWRRFPLDPTATMFRRFWAAAPGALDAAIAPIDQWDAGLTRSATTARPPISSSCWSAAHCCGASRPPRCTCPARNPTAPSAISPRAWPQRSAPGQTFFGFSITPDEALHPARDSGVTAWSVVLQESVDHVRYGLDDAPDDGSTATVHGWQDLDWANPHAAGHTNLPVAGPLAGAVPATDRSRPPSLRPQRSGVPTLASSPPR